MPRTGLTSEQLKEKAIDCAVEEMQKVGFSRVKLSDIAKALGVSHAALYGHFADKSALFDAVTERWLNRIDTTQEELCTEKVKGDALERLTLWFIQLHRMKIEKVKHEPEQFKAFNFSTAIEKSFVQSHMQTMHRQLATIVRQAMDEGLLRTADVDEVVQTLFETTISFHHPVFVANQIGVDREPRLRAILNTVISGLR